MTDLDSLRAKLANLKDLAERPGSAGEAAAATAAIQRLLFRHNLTLDDVKEKRDEFVHCGLHIEGDPTAAAQMWKGVLLDCIARANFCRALSLRTRTYGNAFVIGREPNVSVVVAMYQYLEAEAKRLCRQAWKPQKAMYDALLIDARAERELFNRSFYLAFVAEIRGRLDAQVRESTEDAGDRGTALVIQAEREVDDALARLYPRAVRRAQSVTVTKGGLVAGRNAGQKVNLNKQVGSSQLALSK